MTLTAGLFSLLSTTPALVALQGTHVYPVVLPEGILPGTTYQIVGGSQQATFATSGVQRRRIQFDFRAATYLAADQIRDATIAVLNGFYGALPNGFVLLNSELIQPIDGFDNDARQFRVAAEFYFDFDMQ